jgi:suppressor of ftsI/bilirubin oxidase
MRNPLKEHVRVEGGAVEVWEITNDVRSMPHSMHLHGFPVWVLQRRNSPPQVAEMAVDKSGRLPTDLGLKDAVLVWPGETVKVAVQFGDIGERQLFPFHCHNLEHKTRA